MVADEQDLHDGRDEEQDARAWNASVRLARCEGPTVPDYSQENDGNRKDDLLQKARPGQVWPVVAPRRRDELAGVGVSAAEGRRDVSTAAVAAGPGHDRDGDEAAEEEQIQDQGRDAEALEPADEARQEQGEGGPDDGAARDALDRLDAVGLSEIILRLHREEVRVDGENQDGAQELNQPQQGLARLEESATYRHRGMGC